MSEEEDPSLEELEEQAIRAFNEKLLKAGEEGEFHEQWEAIVGELGGLDSAGEQDLLRIVSRHKPTARVFWSLMYEFQRQHPEPDGLFYVQLLEFLSRLHRAKVKKVRKSRKDKRAA